MNKIFLTDKLNNLSEDFLNVIASVSNYSEILNTNAYIVGGVVRDLLLDKPIYDIDIVIEGVAVDFVRKMETAEICKIIRENPDFGTLKAKFKNGLEIDFASTRTEQYPRKGHLPVVNKIGCSLEEDVLRRDFTVNALALALNPKNFGAVIDFTGGLVDLKKQELRILHEKSFIDDPTRIIRGLRFCHKLNFKLEENTKQLQKTYLETFDNEDICYERIKQVLKLAFNLNSGKLFNEFISEKIYKLTTNTPQKANGNAIEACIKKYEYLVPKEQIWLVYCVFILDLQNLEKFNLNSHEAEVFIEFSKLITQNTEEKTNFEIYEYYKNIPPESIIAYITLSQSPSAIKYLHELKDIKLEITGKDLIDIGFEPQKELGQCLRELLKRKLNGELSSKEDEIQCAKEILFRF